MALIQSKTDAFPSFDTAFWSVADQASVVSGELHIGTVAGYGYAVGSTTYDFTNSYFGCKIVSVPSATDIFTQATLKLDASNLVKFGFNNGNIYCQKKVAGVTTSMTEVAYDANTMTHFRMRHSSADVLVYCETRTAITNWRILGSIAAPSFAITALTPLFESGGNAGADLVLDDMNIFPADVPSGLNVSTQAIHRRSRW